MPYIAEKEERDEPLYPDYLPNYDKGDQLPMCVEAFMILEGFAERLASMLSTMKMSGTGPIPHSPTC